MVMAIPESYASEGKWEMGYGGTVTYGNTPKGGFTFDMTGGMMDKPIEVVEWAHDDDNYYLNITMKMKKTDWDPDFKKTDLWCAFEGSDNDNPEENLELKKYNRIIML